MPAPRHLSTYLALASFWVCISVHGQLDFVKASDLVQETTSGVALCVTDVNGDLLDDIISFHQARTLHVRLQRPSGQGFEFIEHMGLIDRLWSVAAGDIDQDGHIDLLIGEQADESKVIWGPLYLESTPEITLLPGEIFFAQGANLVDLDQDGLLDVFICNDNGLNRLWRYDGERSFTPQPDWIDFRTVPLSDNSGSYAALWSDLDDDGDTDLYISRCRVGVTDPADPRRINQYYERIGDVDYIERASSLELVLGEQSWAADAADLDADGDKDMLVINHDGPSSLLSYGDGTWTDESAGSGVDVDGLPVQVVLQDYDLDGDVDILSTGQQAQYFSNLGSLRFQESALSGLMDHPVSMAVGDLNGDGILDLYVSYPELFNDPSDRPDEILYGTLSSDHHWSILQLEIADGVPAVGAAVEYYGDWGIISRELRSGHSYGIQNSLAVHAGLGTHDQIDSIHVLWPDGSTEVLYDVITDKRYLVVQGLCSTIADRIESGDYLTACTGDTVSLLASVMGDVVWSDGVQSAARDVVDDALLSARVTSDDGCITVLGPSYVDFDPDELPTIQVLTGEIPACAGDRIVLGVDQTARSYAWSTGDTSATIVISEDDVILVSTEGTCTDWLSEPIEISFLEEPMLRIPELDSFDVGDDVMIFIDSPDSIQWYRSDTSLAAVFAGNSVSIDSILSDTSIWVESCVYEITAIVSGGEAEHRGSTQYHFDGLNASMFFDCHEDAVLHDVSVMTDFAGRRAVELWQGADRIFTKVIDIPVGSTRLPLDWSIPAGSDYRLTTSRSQNIEVFGVASPRLWRNPSLAVEYPYSIGDIATITTSSQNELGYYYFYDWRMSAQPVACCTDREEIRVDVRRIVSVNPEYLSDLKIFPIPANHELHISSDLDIVLVEIAGPTGSTWKVKATDRRDLSLDIAGWSSGVYQLRILRADGTSESRSVIISR